MPQNFGRPLTSAIASEKTYVIVMDVDPYDGWTTEGLGMLGGEVGTPQVTTNQKINEARQRLGEFPS